MSSPGPACTVNEIHNAAVPAMVRGLFDLTPAPPASPSLLARLEKVKILLAALESHSAQIQADIEVVWEAVDQGNHSPQDAKPNNREEYEAEIDLDYRVAKRPRTGAEAGTKKTKSKAPAPRPKKLSKKQKRKQKAAAQKAAEEAAVQKAAEEAAGVA
ncbi:hypothetical protein C8R46DRAFT_1186453 [Mycena filopes]|nr:hypothetical protein C8R46DRAFT_1186453 [Mycena filopes]